MSTNKKSLTLLSYLIFLFLGIIFTNWGIYIIYMSHTFRLHLATIGYLFFIPTLAQTLAIFINAHFLAKINLKKQVFTSLFLLLFSIVIISVTSSVLLFILALIVMGTSLGLLFGITNFIILAIHPNEKFSKLNVLNFFYSLGAIIGPLYAGYLLNIHWNWQLVLALSLLIGLFIAGLNHTISYNRLGNTEHSTTHSDEIKIPWHFSIYCIVLAMGCYVLAECVFSVWIVAYLIKYYNFSIGLASSGLTVFWAFITVGRFTARFFQHIKIYKFILLFATIALVSNICVLLTHNTILIYLLIALMGVGYSSLYACTLSYGTDQLPFNCPKLMSILVVAGSIGVILAYPISSFIVHQFSIYAALMAGNIILIILVLSIFLSLLDNKNPHSPKYLP